jgi:hypothetical protein
MVSETDNFGSIASPTEGIMIAVYMIAPAIGGVLAGMFKYMNQAAQQNMI